MDDKDIKRREEAAVAAIKAAFGALEQEEDGVTMFVEHHLEELEPEYWEKHLGSAKPDPRKVLDLLVLRSHWDDDSIFDFTLPEDVTDYVISVSFDEDGEVEDIAMES